MDISEKITALIEKQVQWSEELSIIREVFLETELEEEIKWGAPAYTINKKIVVGMMGFKHHLGIWFHQGVFLKDPHNILINAQEGKTKGLRHWRVKKGDVIQTEILKNYTLEAIQNCKDGKEIKPEQKKLVLSEFLKTAFLSTPILKAHFKMLSPGKQKEYALYISEAKLEATKLRRLEKIKPMIMNGVGLHDKYKNC